MKIQHHDLTFEFPDEWWDEAGMAEFTPGAAAYRNAPAISLVSIVSIQTVGPVRRQGIFCDSEQEGTARARVMRIFRAFREDVALPAVEIVKGTREYGHPFRLTHGAHRFYCSLAAGFSDVPTVTGYDINDPSA